MFNANLSRTGNNDDSVVYLRPDNLSRLERVRNEQNKAPTLASSSYEQIFVFKGVVVVDFAMQECRREGLKQSLQNESVRRFDITVIKDDGNARSHILCNHFVHQID